MNIKDLNKKPTVVLDWGWIRTLRQGTDILPNGFHYCIPDTCFREALTASKGDPIGFARKLQRICRLNENKIWIANYWQDVSVRERPGSGEAPLSWLYNDDSNRLLEEFVATSSEKLAKNLVRVIADENSAELAKEFCDLCASYTHWLTGLGLHLVRELEDESKRFEHLRQPGLFAEAFARELPAFDNDEGIRALSCFPDVYAAGRNMRIVAYYATEHALGKTAKFENNWDDASYAFVASYTGFLATNDNGLVKATQTVFPQVQFWNRQAVA